MFRLPNSAPDSFTPKNLNLVRLPEHRLLLLDGAVDVLGRALGHARDDLARRGVDHTAEKERGSQQSDSREGMTHTADPRSAGYQRRSLLTNGRLRI